MADHALLTIDNPSAALTDFSLIVDLSKMPAAWWTAVTSSDGTKGRVYKGDGTTRLAADWIDFDSTAETGLLRVLWSGTLATTGTQQLWIEPPLTGNDAVAADAAHGSDNAYDSSWKGYWPNGGGADRTSNSNDGTAGGGVTVGGATGRIGKATTFDGSNDVITIATSASLEPTSLTISIWFKVPDDLNNLVMFENNANNGFSLQKHPGFGGKFLLNRGGNSSRVYNTSASNPFGTSWAYGAVTKVQAGAALVYPNGTEATNSDATGNATYNSQPVYIGSRNGSYGINGDLQEVQLHSVVRAAGWIGHEYAQTNDNENFYTWSWVSGGGVTGSGSGSQLVQTGSGSGTVSIDASGSGDQLPQSGVGSGAVVITGSGQGSQPVQTGTGRGGAVPITGTGSGFQVVQTGQGSGDVVISGFGVGAQLPQTGSASGSALITGSGSGSQDVQTGSGSQSVVGIASLEITSKIQSIGAISHVLDLSIGSKTNNIGASSALSTIFVV